MKLWLPAEAELLVEHRALLQMPGELPPAPSLPTPTERTCAAVQGQALWFRVGPGCMCRPGACGSMNVAPCHKWLLPSSMKVCVEDATCSANITLRVHTHMTVATLKQQVGCPLGTTLPPPPQALGSDLPLGKA